MVGKPRHGKKLKVRTSLTLDPEKLKYIRKHILAEGQTLSSFVDSMLGVYCQFKVNEKGE